MEALYTYQTGQAPGAREEHDEQGKNGTMVNVGYAARTGIRAKRTLNRSLRDQAAVTPRPRCGVGSL